MRVVAQGDALLAPGVTRRLIAEFARMGAPRGPDGRRAEGLTERETEVRTSVMRAGRAVLVVLTCAALVLCTAAAGGRPPRPIPLRPLPMLTRQALAARYATDRDAIGAAASGTEDPRTSERLRALAAPGRTYVPRLRRTRPGGRGDRRPGERAPRRGAHPGRRHHC